MDLKTLIEARLKELYEKQKRLPWCKQTEKAIAHNEKLLKELTKK